MKLYRYTSDCDGCTCDDNEGEFYLVKEVEPLIEINKEMLGVLIEYAKFELSETDGMPEGLMSIIEKATGKSINEVMK